jgi:hypothetical protein
MWALPVIFRVIAQVNNRPLGEFSLNLVTLISSKELAA